MLKSTEQTPRFLRRIEVEHLTGLSRATIFAHVAAGSFPKPIKISANKNAWLESEVYAWMAARLACRDMGAAHASAA
jgi:prophage regulatory protein